MNIGKGAIVEDIKILMIELGHLAVGIIKAGEKHTATRHQHASSITGNCTGHDLLTQTTRVIQQLRNTLTRTKIGIYEDLRCVMNICTRETEGSEWFRYDFLIQQLTEQRTMGTSAESVEPEHGSVHDRAAAREIANKISKPIGVRLSPVTMQGEASGEQGTSPASGNQQRRKTHGGRRFTAGEFQMIQTAEDRLAGKPPDMNNILRRWGRNSMARWLQHAQYWRAGGA
jgi:hypothetical protein